MNEKNLVVLYKKGDDLYVKDRDTIISDGGDGIAAVVLHNGITEHVVPVAELTELGYKDVTDELRPFEINEQVALALPEEKEKRDSLYDMYMLQNVVLTGHRVTAFDSFGIDDPKPQRDLDLAEGIGFWTAMGAVLDVAENGQGIQVPCVKIMMHGFIFLGKLKDVDELSLEELSMRYNPVPVFMPKEETSSFDPIYAVRYHMLNVE